MANDYGLDEKGSEFESQLTQEFSLLHVVQTGSGAHPAFYSMGTGVKRQVREADHSLPANADVKKKCESIHTYAFIA
jgi:hypothetical protein